MFILPVFFWVLIIVLTLSLVIPFLLIKISKLYFSNNLMVSRLGGVAVLITWWTAMLLLDLFDHHELLPLFIASFLIMIAGLWDSHRPLGPFAQLFIQLTIAGVAVFFGGIYIKYVTNPFGGIITFDAVNLFWGVTPGVLLSLLWIIIIMNAINFMDGLDGLAGSVTGVAFVAIGLVSLLPQVNDLKTAVAAFIATIAIAGFLFWNYPPASMMLGTTGSWFLGFLLAIFAIQGTTKIATTVMVSAVPLLDALVVIFGRIIRGASPFKGDLTHLHHRLKRRGLSDRFILALYGACSLILGLGAVLLQTHNKIIIFMIFSVMFIFLVYLGSRLVRHRIAKK